MNRRPIKTRSTRAAQALASGLIRTAITPDQISIASVVFAVAGAAALLGLPGPLGLVLCAFCVQLRLLCNLMDGMVAVEGGKKSPLGDLFNEIPDRVADSIFLVALGYASGLVALGWCAALVAALTAYIRVLGGALGLPQDFRGPQSKSQRMAVMTAACLLAAIELALRGSQQVLELALVVITAGAVLTCFLRLRAMAALLRARAAG